MHYRITKIRFRPETYEKVFSTMDSRKKDILKIEGVEWVDSIKTSESEIMVIAKYDKSESADAATPKVKEMLETLSDFVTAPPERVHGDVVWTTR